MSRQEAQRNCLPAIKAWVQDSTTGLLDQEPTAADGSRMVGLEVYDPTIRRLITMTISPSLYHPPSPTNKTKAIIVTYMIPVFMHLQKEKYMYRLWEWICTDGWFDCGHAYYGGNDRLIYAFLLNGITDVASVSYLMDFYFSESKEEMTRSYDIWSNSFGRRST